jgi:LPXTG-motif cell wall-anchored protein
MAIINKRNAVLGWSVWQVSKRVAKKKAKQAAPGRVDDTNRPNKGAIVSGLAAAGGALWFWRRRRRGDGDGESS